MAAPWAPNVHQVSCVVKGRWNQTMDEILLAIFAMHCVHVHSKCVIYACGLVSHSW